MMKKRILEKGCRQRRPEEGEHRKQKHSGLLQNETYRPRGHSNAIVLHTFICRLSSLLLRFIAATRSSRVETGAGEIIHGLLKSPAGS